MDLYEKTASQLVRALRGRRSRAALSRLAGYRSNIVQRWEAGDCWPRTSVYLQLRQRLRPAAAPWQDAFFRGAAPPQPTVSAQSPGAVCAFLAALRGRVTISSVAAHSGHNRYTVARWMDGRAEPRLPDFLRVADTCCRRLPDLVAALDDPERIAAVRGAWRRLERARQAAYDAPFSHAVLRALELEELPRGRRAQRAFIVRVLGCTGQEVDASMDVLVATGQVRAGRTGFSPDAIPLVDTRQDPERARALRAAWTETALQRLRSGSDGQFGYSVFSVSAGDLERLKELHLQYVRAMQEVIASSTPADRVALYCAQLLDLGGGDAPSYSS